MAIVLVTGAAGFIGSHTVDLLLAGGHRVIGIDNLRTGALANLAMASDCGTFEFSHMDVNCDGELDRLVARCRPDAIIHLAALVSVVESIKDPDLNFQLNINATHVVAEAARRHRIPRAVFASSAAVYGDASELPISEDTPKRPISPYGAAKLASEAVLLGHAATFGFTAVCLRYFNVFGPRQDPQSPYTGVISIFHNKLRAGLAPMIFGNGEQTRDFISVHDVAAANVIAALCPKQTSCAVNICSGQSTTLNRVAAILGRAYPAAPKPIYAAARTGDILHSCGTVDRAQSELNFSAHVNIETGLADLVKNSVSPA